MDPRFIPELNERLFTHFTGGAWRAPLSDRHVPVRGAGGRALGQIVCAGPADVARACGMLRATAVGQAVDGAALWAAMLAEAPLLAALRADEGFAHDRLRGPRPGLAIGPPPGAGPLVLLTAAAAPVDRIVAALIAGGVDTGLIWKPAPGAAASAHLIMRVLGPRAQGRLVLLQGDHETGALLAGQGRLVWAGVGAVPAELPAPALDMTPFCRAPD